MNKMNKMIMVMMLLLGTLTSSAQGPPDGEFLTGVVNSVIKSDAIQNMTFKVSSDCVESTLNDIELCNTVEVKDSYSSSVIDDVCVEAAQVVKDAEDYTTDALRKTCKGLCSTIDWTCGGCCSDGCQSDSDELKKLTQDEYDATVSLCEMTTLTGGYDFKITNVKGLGGIMVTSITDPVVHSDNSTLFSVTITMNIPTVTSNAWYKIWQDPIPVIDGNLPLVVSNVPVSASGTLVDRCGDGYYLQIDELDIVVPSNVFDSNLLLEILASIGADINFITGGIVNLNQMFLDWVSGYLDEEVTDVLNDVLSDYKICGPGC